MIGGQIVDLECEEKSDVTEEILNYLHNRKTGALIKAAAVVGALAADASDEVIKTISNFARKLGLAFQIQDDILDFVGDESILGKPIGSDAQKKKTTYVTLLGIEEAKKKADEITREAVELLDIFGNRAEFVKELAIHLLDRKY